jgi:hypothetical protein
MAWAGTADRSAVGGLVGDEEEPVVASPQRPRSVHLAGDGEPIIEGSHVGADDEPGNVEGAFGSVVGADDVVADRLADVSEGDLVHVRRRVTCVHCYAGSGPDGTHGTMTPQAWEAVLTQAAALGARMVCFIGGEPTLDPALPRLVRHALSLGMEAEAFSNLVRVSPELWDLLGTPGAPCHQLVLQ